MASIRKLLVAAFLPLALIAPSAHAQDAATVVGQGTITPGPPTSGCAFQSVHFDGTAVDAGLNAGVYNFTFDGGSSICETLAAGQGSGTLNGDVTGSVNYSRTGAVVTITGQVILNGGGHTIVVAVCVFVATSVGPVRTYTLVCQAVIV